MAEYIEREKALKALSEARELDDGWHSIDDIIDMVYSRIEDIPSASVRPERHGEWIVGKPNVVGNLPIICSECGTRTLTMCSADWWTEKKRFCFECGAKMDGKDGESNG